jgi:hypothetical protein
MRKISVSLLVLFLFISCGTRTTIDTEPIGMSSGQTWSWIHLDVRKFGRYLKDEYFIKSKDKYNFNKKIIEIKN